MMLLRRSASFILIVTLAVATLSTMADGTDGGYKDDDEGCFCIAVFDPVCGADGNTYSNACLAGCAGVEVVGPGPCCTERFELCKPEKSTCCKMNDVCDFDKRCISNPAARCATVCLPPGLAAGKETGHDNGYGKDPHY